MRWVVSTTPQPLYPRERPGTHCIGGWVGPRAGLDGCGKSRPPTGIRFADRPASRESLYRLSYPGPFYFNAYSKILKRVRKTAKSVYQIRHVCLSVCPSVRPYGITLLPLEGFPLNFSIFRKSLEKIQITSKSDKLTDTLHEDVLTFVKIPG